MNPDVPASSSGPTCGATCGVTRERDRQKLAARALATLAYPQLRWAPTPAWLPDDPPISTSELGAYAAALECVLPTRALLRVCNDDDCDAIYLLAGVHAPCALELRDGDRPAPSGTSPDTETYLRIAFSPLGRYYSLQETRMRVERDRDGVWTEERRLVGVEDRRLQTFVKATQGYLRKQKLVGLDAAFLADRLAEEDRVTEGPAGTIPTLWNALFERTPQGSIRGVFVSQRDLADTSASH